ncbi:MAG: metallophosphoesterase [Deltaproteobacteria bacterium]|jgi:predicted MPP superfamily phosphohydrolase|nr:metallophosphoesterase [Deltaproteobacteria bacterium]
MFLVIYLSVYGGTHFYAFVKLKNGLSLNAWASACLAVFMGVMVLAPILMRLAERHGNELIARGMAYVGFIWMGLLFVFVSVLFFFDIYRFFLSIGRFVFHTYLLSITPTAGFVCGVSLLTACSVMAYGFFEALNIRLEHVSITTDKLPNNLDNLKIAQISDIHLGVMVGERRLKKILDKVRAAAPHILVSTGDLVDGRMENPDILAGMLREIETPLGKYAVTGNHEYYSGLSRALDFTQNAGFVLLRGETRTLSNSIHIAGVDDPAGKSRGTAGSHSESRLLSTLSSDLFILLLKHQPLVDNNSAPRFDLQLSGHTHNGQIFPFSLLTRLFYKTHPGLNRLPAGSFAYVSRGSGTWGPPARFLSPPEVTLIEIVRKNQ